MKDKIKHLFGLRCSDPAVYCIMHLKALPLVIIFAGVLSYY